MIFLEQNIRGLCTKFGLDFEMFLTDFQVDGVTEIPLVELEAICEEYELDLEALLFKPMYKSEYHTEKLAEIKLLILDVDGVMTDGGMYFTENDDQYKKFNTKDGMGIMELTKNKIVELGIISSAFKGNAVRNRAEMLGIKRCYVGRDAKMSVLETWLEELGITMENVAIIGDDVNDLPIMKKAGFSACPSDAVQVVKQQVNLILNTKGGYGCIREFIDNYLLPSPIGSK
jgi:3-deoxy-D-manno-octulosonate 8-phosphate phosphatase (KDO 8-P phosphatase)